MITITLIDEVNCHVGGLSTRRMADLAKSMSYSVPGAFQTVAFQLKEWDGTESLIDEEGFTYSYYLDHIADFLSEIGVADDSVEILDLREPQPDLPDWEVPADFIKEYIGFEYRPHQLKNINLAIKQRVGVLDAATNAGKTYVCGTIVKYYEDYLPSITLVPTSKLMRQTYDEYDKLGIDVIKIDKKLASNKKRLTAIREHRHVIMTTKLLHNILKYEDSISEEDRVITGRPRVVLYDEVHRFGDTMFNAFKMAFHNCPVRIGMSGTIKKMDPLKKAKIFGCLGGGVIDKVSAKQLIDSGFASKPSIVMYKTHDEAIEELCTPELVKRGKWDWEKEVKYYNNSIRVAAIADFIQNNRDGVNTLILCHAELGAGLSRMLECPLVYCNTPEKERDAMFSHFDESEDETFFCASFDTSATGISQNNIHRLYLIDARKNEVHIMQGIGRGLRLDGKDNELEVIDICSNTYYAKRHSSTRKNIYKRESFPFTESKTRIWVK